MSAVVVGWGLRVAPDLDAAAVTRRAVRGDVVPALPTPDPVLPALGARPWRRAGGGTSAGDGIARSRLAVAACEDALAVAGTDPVAAAAPERRAVVLATEFGSESVVAVAQRDLLGTRPARVGPTLFTRSVDNHLLGELARRFGCHGPTVVVAGAVALEVAAGLVARARADVVLVVGSDDLAGPLSLLPGLTGTAARAGTAAQEGAAAQHGTGPDEDLVPVEAAGALCVVPAARAAVPGLRVVRSVQRRRRSAVPFACDAATLTGLLGAPGGDRPALAVLAAGSGRGAAHERDALTRALGDGPVAIAPWRVVGEPFGAKEVGGVAVACEAVRTGAVPRADPAAPVLALATDGAGTCRVTALVPAAPV